MTNLIRFCATGCGTRTIDGRHKYCLSCARENQGCRFCGSLILSPDVTRWKRRHRTQRYCADHDCVVLHRAETELNRSNALLAICAKLMNDPSLDEPASRRASELLTGQANERRRRGLEELANLTGRVVRVQLVVDAQEASNLEQKGGHLATVA